MEFSVPHLRSHRRMTVRGIQRGAILINGVHVHTPRVAIRLLEISNPGSLPAGVTPENVLQAWRSYSMIWISWKRREADSTRCSRSYIVSTFFCLVPKVRESHDTVILTLDRCPPDSTVNFISAVNGAHGRSVKAPESPPGQEARWTLRLESLPSVSGKGGGKKYVATFQRSRFRAGNRAPPSRRRDVYLHPMSLHSRIGEAVSRSAMQRTLSRRKGRGPLPVSARPRRSG